MTLPWQNIEFPKSIQKTTVGRNNQVLSSEIQLSGRFPVIDQGQAFIAGYTDTENKVICDGLPLVVFGDHTRCVKYVDFPFVLGADGTKVFKPKEGLFDPKFFYYALINIDLPNRGYNRHFTVLKEKSVPHPGMDEQRRIAAVLGTVQRAIEEQERLLQLTTELKKSLLHKLFTEGLRGEPQKMTEIGPVPESWRMATLGELASKPDSFLQTGPFGSQLHKHDYQEDGIGVVNPTHLYGNRINHENIPRVGPKIAVLLEKHSLQPGDILFARRGEIGRHGMVTKQEEGWLCGTGCFLGRVRQAFIDNRFLSYFFSIPGVVAWLNGHAAGAIMPNLNNTVLRSIPVFYPDINVQVEIADCLDAAEQKTVIHDRKYTIHTDLFRTLLHQLMTAQIRINNLNMQNLGLDQGVII